MRLGGGAGGTSVSRRPRRLDDCRGAPSKGGCGRVASGARRLGGGWGRGAAAGLPRWASAAQMSVGLKMNQSLDKVT